MRVAERVALQDVAREDVLVEAALEIVGPGAPSVGRSIAAVDALRQIDDWGAEHAAAAVVRPGEVVAQHGDEGHVFRWASVTKPVTALAVLVAAEEGTVDLDEPAGPPGSTVRHLLAHASGLPFTGDAPIARPGERRIYSNTGFDVSPSILAERAEMPFAEYLSGAVLEPLGMRADLRGSAAADLFGTLDDLMLLGRELLTPMLVAPETLAEATTVAFPGLAGVLPDFGRFDPNDWGLGFELRDGRPRTGPGRPTRRGRSATSAAPGRSSGSIRAPETRARAASPTATSGSGRRRHGRRFRTRSWPRVELASSPGPT